MNYSLTVILTLRRALLREQQLFIPQEIANVQFQGVPSAGWARSIGIELSVSRIASSMCG